MRVGFVEWPEALVADSEQWKAIADQVAKEQLDILVTNELPLGPWIAAAPRFDKHLANQSIEYHRVGLEALRRLNVIGRSGGQGYADLLIALEADTIILAVPFGQHRAAADALPNLTGKTVIDAMNTYGMPPEDLNGLPSSAFVAKALASAKVVKGFNHLVAAT